MVKLEYYKLQVSSIEFIVLLIIFLVGILTVLSVQNKKLSELIEYYEDLTLLRDLDTLDVLLDVEGEPKNWNSTNFKSLGLRTEGKIDIEKVNALKEIGYEKVKEFLGIRNNFCLKDFNFGNCNINRSKKIFVLNRIVPLRDKNSIELREIKFFVWN